MYSFNFYKYVYIYKCYLSSYIKLSFDPGDLYFISYST